MKEVLQFINEQTKELEKENIVIAVSGGSDSMCLLNLLLDARDNNKFNIICAHVNHNVRKESESEEEFVKEYCAKNGVIFECHRIDNYSKDNFHNDARNIRYNFFEEIVNKYHAKFLLTAHHGDDLVETVLMRIVRGSSLRGYAGFESIIEKENYRIFRPLIYVTKLEIEEYCLINKIPYVTDLSNFKDVYTRNRYRKQILPFLKKEDLSVHLKFLKYSETLLKCNKYIDKQVLSAYNNVYNKDFLDINKYNELDEYIKEQVIYLILTKIYKSEYSLITDVHVMEIINLINNSKPNLSIILPKDVKIVRSYDKLIFNCVREEVTEYKHILKDKILFPGNKMVEIVENCEIDTNMVCRINSSEVKLPLYVRNRRNGDKMTIKNMHGTKKIKDIFINKQIPIDKRTNWPILVDSNDEILWIPGLQKSKFNKKIEEKYDIIIWYR